jgi:hypothetical protein
MSSDKWGEIMVVENEKGWRLNRQVNLSVIVQVVLLASLIIGSWVNLQRQLDLLQKDVSLVLESQKRFADKVEQLQTKSIAYEYRLATLEKQVNGKSVQTSKYDN